jgi:DNA-binding MarR family transcriptional regulator
MTKRPAYRLEDQVGFIIRRVSQRHAAIFASRMAHGLTPTQWAALVKVAEFGAISQNLLGRETAMDAATIKGVVDRLRVRNLIKVKADPKDRRRGVIELTAQGEKCLADGVPPARRITTETLVNLSADEQRTLHALLSKMC